MTARPIVRERALTPTVTVKRASDIIPGYRGWTWRVEWRSVGAATHRGMAFTKLGARFAAWRVAR